MKEMVGGCCVCSDERGWPDNPLVYCDGNGCTVAVHQACYGIVTVPKGPWFCRKCESPDRQARVRCELCPSRAGALKKSDSGGWAHVVCALYIPEVRFGNVTSMEPILLQHIPPERFNKTCYICQEIGKLNRASAGACMQCNKSGCKQQFHVTCAQSLGLLCEEAGNYLDNVKYCGYCKHHYSKLIAPARESRSLKVRLKVKNEKRGGNVKTIPPYKPISQDSHSSDSSPEKDIDSSPSPPSGGASGSAGSSSITPPVLPKSLKPSAARKLTAGTVVSRSNQRASGVGTQLHYEPPATSSSSGSSNKQITQAKSIPSTSKTVTTQGKLHTDKTQIVRKSSSPGEHSASSSIEISSAPSNQISVTTALHQLHSQSSTTDPPGIGSSGQSQGYPSKFLHQTSSNKVGEGQQEPMVIVHPGSTTLSRNMEPTTQQRPEQMKGAMIPPIRITKTQQASLTTMKSQHITSGPQNSSLLSGGSSGSSEVIDYESGGLPNITQSAVEQLDDLFPSSISSIKHLPPAQESLQQAHPSSQQQLDTDYFDSTYLGRRSGRPGVVIPESPPSSQASTSQGASVSYISQPSPNHPPQRIYDLEMPRPPSPTYHPAPSKLTDEEMPLIRPETPLWMLDDGASKHNNNRFYSSHISPPPDLSRSESTTSLVVSVPLPQSGQGLNLSTHHQSAESSCIQSPQPQASTSIWGLKVGYEPQTPAMPPIQQPDFGIDINKRKRLEVSDSGSSGGSRKRRANSPMLIPSMRNKKRGPMISHPTPSTSYKGMETPMHPSQSAIKRTPMQTPSPIIAIHDFTSKTSPPHSPGPDRAARLTKVNLEKIGRAPHMLGNELNPESAAAARLSEHLSAELAAHSVFRASSPLVPPPLINRGSVRGGLTASGERKGEGGAQNLDQLLERHWEQGSQFLMEQAQHFDIASLLSCLHQLRTENVRLEEHVDTLLQRRDHLLAVNARLAIPLNSGAGNLNVPPEINRSIRDAKEPPPHLKQQQVIRVDGGSIERSQVVIREMQPKSS